MSLLRSRGGRDRRLRARARSRSAMPAIDRAARRAVAGFSASGMSRAKAALERVMRAARVDNGDGHGRRIENAGETHLGGAQILGRLFAGRAIE